MLAPPKRNDLPSSCSAAPERVTKPVGRDEPGAEAANGTRARRATAIPSRIAAFCLGCWAVAPPPLRRNRDFVLLQVGQLLSTVGGQMTAIAYPLLVLALTHSAARAGVVGFARVLPYPICGLLAGAAADRWNRKT